MLFQIALVRIFSFAIWHHFSFMVISVALLGFSVSGVALHHWPALGRPAHFRAGWYAAAYGLTAILAIVLVAELRVDPEQLARNPVHIVFLLGHYLLLTVPFTFAGLAIVTLLGAHPKKVSF